MQLQTHKPLPQAIQRAVGDAFTQRFNVEHGLQTAVPPNDLKDAYDRGLEDALAAAAHALVKIGPAPTSAADIAAFADRVASVVQFHPSQATLPLDLKNPINLTPEARFSGAVKKGVCPFMGMMMAHPKDEGGFDLFGNKEQQLIPIKDVMAGIGPGTLGPEIGRLFAEGNQTRMKDASGALTADCPPGFMSAELDGSQGAAQKGTLGLMRDREAPPSVGGGELHPERMEWLRGFAVDGALTAEGFGKAIAANLWDLKQKDPTMQVAGKDVFLALGLDFVKALGKFPAHLMEEIGQRIHGEDPVGGPAEILFKQALTKGAGVSPLLQKAGEWGLQLASFAHAPGAEYKNAAGKVQVPVAAIEQMVFEKQKPAGFQDWEKNTSDWIKASTEILYHAAREYHRLKEGAE